MKLLEQRGEVTEFGIELEMNFAIVDSILQSRNRAGAAGATVFDGILIEGNNVCCALEIVGAHLHARAANQ